MGLILPQIVKIRPATKNLKHFKNLGYEIPTEKAIRKIRGKFVETNNTCTAKNVLIEVDVNDLPPFSNAKVAYNCDCCGVLKYIAYADYTRRHTNPDRPIYCYDCNVRRTHSGEINFNWFQNLSQTNHEKDRKYPEYTEFVKRVLARDNYTCQCCGKKSTPDIEVHHLNGYSWDIEHRTDDTNGITLCAKCHKAFHCLYGMKNNTKEQYEEWIGHIVSLFHYDGIIDPIPQVYCIEDDIVYTNRFEAAEQLGCSPESIRCACTHTKNVYTYKGKHYLYYDKYLLMSQEDIIELLKKGNQSYREDKRVLCKNTGLIFDSPSKGGKYYNYPYIGNINSACKNPNHSAGKKDNYSLQWMWYSEFESLTKQEQISIAKQNESTLEVGSFLYNLLHK